MAGKVGQREKYFGSKEKVLGQFYTPREVAEFVVSVALQHLPSGGAGCDPACGEGVFVEAMLRGGFRRAVGVDVDAEAIRRAGELVGAQPAVSLVVGDALLRTPTLTSGSLLEEGLFDLVCGNPPFSAKYGRVGDHAVLSQYVLGRGRRSQAVEILFLERFVRLAREGGVVGIVLPDGVFLNLNYRGVREFILEHTKVLAVVSLPRGIFGGGRSTTSKTSILLAVKGGGGAQRAFMAEARSLDELPVLLEMYRAGVQDGVRAVWAEVSAESLHPKTYLGRPTPHFKYPARPLGGLVSEMVTGATEYGEKRRFSSAGLRFISAKVVTPLGLDFKRDSRFVEPGSIMDKRRARVRVGDVVFVRVGVGTIGRAAVVVDGEDLGVADDWTYILRVREELLSPYYLAVFLQTKHGRVQLDRLRRGVGTVTVPKTLLGTLLVPIPDRGFQEKIGLLYREMVGHMRAGRYDEAWRLHDEMVALVEGEVA